MAGNLNPNLPLGNVTKPPVADPNVEGASSGMNAGSCHPGIGINTGDYSPKTDDWAEVVISPGKTGPIGWGGDNTVTGQTATVNIVAADYANTDFNDTTAFIQADASTAPGAELDATTGAVNRTGKTVPANAWVWGTVPVA